MVQSDFWVGIFTAGCEIFTNIKREGKNARLNDKKISRMKERRWDFTCSSGIAFLNQDRMLVTILQKSQLVSLRRKC